VTTLNNPQLKRWHRLALEIVKLSEDGVNKDEKETEEAKR
jgi:hypothetical protein